MSVSDSTTSGSGLLALGGVSVRYGRLAAIDEVSVEFQAGTIHGIIGPNGAGKTTLLNAVSGFTHISAGEVRLDGTCLNELTATERVGFGLVRGFQTVRLLEDETVFDNVLLGCERFSQPWVVPQLFNAPSQIRARKRDVESTWQILEVLGLADDALRSVSELPFASRRLTEISRILVVRPKVLLLDEPAAGLDVGERHRLTDTLREYHAREPFTMLVIEHDVDLVRRLCSHSVALDSGQVIAEGPPSDVLGNARVKTAYFGVGHDA